MSRITRAELERAVADRTGAAVVASQLADIKSDVSGLAARFDRHEADHRQETTERRSARRWLVVTGIAFLAMVETPLGILIAHVRW